MNEKTITNWIKLAEYDFNTAKSMLTSKRYLYVAFTCQQAIEKLLKALYVKEKNETPPYTHNLLKLIENISISKIIEKDKKEFIEILNSYYIQSRYTEELSNLSQTINNAASKNIYKKTKDLYLWLKKMI